MIHIPSRLLSLRISQFLVFAHTRLSSASSSRSSRREASSGWCACRSRVQDSRYRAFHKKRERNAGLGSRIYCFSYYFASIKTKTKSASVIYASKRLSIGKNISGTKISTRMPQDVGRHHFAPERLRPSSLLLNLVGQFVGPGSLKQAYENQRRRHPSSSYRACYTVSMCVWGGFHLFSITKVIHHVSPCQGRRQRAQSGLVWRER